MAKVAFVHRSQEMADLNRLTRRPEPCLVLVYGRRRVGKSTLLQHWAKQSGLPTFYWESPRGTAESVRASLLSELYRWAGERVVETRPHSEDWLDVFRAMRRMTGERPAVVILDEFPWAVESDPSLPSRLKTAWDNVFTDSQIRLFIAGSHISAMEKLLLSDAPLFGRMTGKLYVRPFAFVEIAPFVPRHDLEKRLAVYAILGGIPDYLRRWDDQADLMTNIREIFLSDTSPFRNEHSVLISDVLRRESPDYEAVLASVGRGHHDLDSIATESVLSSGRTANVLGILTELRLIERRIRASVPVAQHEQARHARYFLSDPFLQFYYRFVAPNRSRIAQGLYDELERQFREQVRAFVGGAFEELCRTWTLAQARAGGLPFSPEFVGSDWGPQHQADVVAVNWRDHQVLIGEAKWMDEPMDHKDWRQVVERAEKVIQRLKAADPARKPRQEPPPWQQQLMIFSRHGGTPAVRAAAKKAGARVITFAEIVRDLGRLPEKKIR
jgi:AAA+ ATPase superfamily predicted ATPase